MGEDPNQEEEEEGQWEGRGRTTTKGRHAVGGDYEYYYSPPPMVSSEAAPSSCSDLEIMFGFGGEEAVVTAYGYTNIVFAGFS